MISTRTGKDPVTPFLNPWSDPAPAGASRQPRQHTSPQDAGLGASQPAIAAAPSASASRHLVSALAVLCHFDRSPRADRVEKPAFWTRVHTASLNLAHRRLLATALLGGLATAAAAISITVVNHYETPAAPLAAPPVALTHVPNAVQALASAKVNKKHNRFVEALHLNRLGTELSGLHPIRTMQRPLAALGNPLRGIATWYGDVLQGHTTASGEIFDDQKMTAAHKTLPLGTVVRVTDLRSRRSVVVRINDRGTLAPGRIIDLSSAAAEQLGILRAGVANVKLEVVRKPAQS